MGNRKPCKECPWENKHKFSEDWKRYAKIMTNAGKIDDNVHACHMITSDSWGFNEPITYKNVCVGSCKNKN